MFDYCPPFIPMAKVLPECKQGNLAIEHFAVDAKEAKHLRGMASFSFSNQGYGDFTPGTYAKLKQGNTLWMSDTVMERRTNRYIVSIANGHVLIGGLGMGMIIIPMLLSDSVKSITVLEINAELINLVKPHLTAYAKKRGKARKLNILHGDVYTYPKASLPGPFDTIYMDIWPDICGDNWEDMKRLGRLYRGRLNKANPNAYIGYWEKARCQYYAKRG